MQLTAPLPHSPLVSAATIVINWADLDAQHRTSDDINAMLDWVRTSPTRRNIHVVLPSSPVTARLQRSLQSLGCTVTRKMGF